MSTVEIPVFNMSGEEVGKYALDTEKIAAYITPQLLHDAVVMYRANLRQGSAQTKRRSDVSGSKKKMYRQKGTGNARAGHKRSGVRRGGGHIFALRPRDFYFRLTRKALQTATRMALLSKIVDSKVMLLDSLKLHSDKPKTKEMATVLKALKIDKTVLVAIEKYDSLLYKSLRNIDGVKVLPVFELNAYEILKPKQVVMTKEALEKFIQSIPAKTQVS